MCSPMPVQVTVYFGSPLGVMIIACAGSLFRFGGHPFYSCWQQLFWA